MGGPPLRLHSGPAFIAVLVLALFAGPAAAASSGVAGRVVTAAEPIAQATVYAYQTVEKSLRKVFTDEAGRFRFGDLPAGLYKIVAHKSGFVPTVAVVAHQRDDEAQFVEVELTPTTTDAEAESFWTLRSEIPSDVLREIEAPLAIELAGLAPPPRPSSSFLAEMTALTGVEQVSAETMAQVTGGSVGLAGRVGPMRVELKGDFRSVDSGLVAWAEDGAQGRASAVRLNLESPRQGRFDLSTANHSLLKVVDGDSYPVDYSQVQVNWRRPVGEDGATGFLAQYVSESGLYTNGWVEPMAIPVASRALRVEGSYSRRLGDTGRVRAGLRYRERAGDYANERAYLAGAEGGAQRWIDAYGVGDWSLNSLVVLQYGLYTTLRDGSVSLTPRGGVVLRFTPSWQATLLASHRVALEENRYAASDFAPVLLEQTLGCEDTELSCYQLQLLYGDGDADHLEIGASYRELDQTLRLFTSDEFFARDEGLFLVPGDQLPEVHASVRRRVAPSVVTRVSTNYAAGGGGSFLAQNRRAYENEVALLTTAVDTTFERTSTGVYLAFHRLEQRLEPVWNPLARRRVVPAEVGYDRLELVVSQDLAPLFDLASDWAVRLGMEVSRGATLFQEDPENRDVLRHRLLTGLAVRF